MADIINLKHFKKKQARAGAETRANENRIRFGQTKAERTRQTLEKQSFEKTLDAHALVPKAPPKS
ncbi:MAG: DUF4169 family protein [Hyphomicrobiales bacterium]